MQHGDEVVDISNNPFSRVESAAKASSKLGVIRLGIIILLHYGVLCVSRRTLLTSSSHIETGTTDARRSTSCRDLATSLQHEQLFRMQFYEVSLRANVATAEQRKPP